MLSPRVQPFFILVVYVCPKLFGVNCDTVSSPHIRILDVATKSSETRLIPHRIEYESDFHPKYQQQPNWYEQNRRPLKSYVIYDEYPVKIFKEWKGDADISVSRPPFLLELSRHPDAELTPDYYLRNRPQVLPSEKPTLAYHSVYSNIIKVFDDTLDDFGSNRFKINRVPKPYDGGGVWKSFQPPVQYESVYPQEIPRAPYQDEKLPDSFPKIFSPNTNFHFTPFSQDEPKPPKHFYPQRGYYDTHTVNYNEEGKRVDYNPEDAEFLPEIDTNPKNQKVFLCSFIRLNQKQFPESGQPCSRSEDNFPILAPEYPDYSNLPNDKIPVEHRRQHHQMKRIKRSEDKPSRNSRPKRASGLGYSYGTWSSPFGYENSYDGYFSDYYPSRGGYGSFGSNYGNNYYRNNGNRDRYQRYRNRYYSDSRSNYDDYDDEYQNNEDSNSKGLTSYLTSGGRRYKNRKNNDDDDDNDDEDNDNNNNHDDDSDEEMERQNSGRRGSNDRRNNDDSRDRRRNNNNNNSNSNNNNNNNSNNSNNNNYDDDDSRDSRRNNNRQNSNSRRNNKRYNDKYDYNNRNRNGYGSSSGYGFSNGYGNSNGGYGNSYGGNNGYGTSGGYGNNGYSNGYGNGYGNGYSSHGGFGYGSGYGNGFSSI